MEIGPLPSQGLPVTMKASVVASEAHDVVAVPEAERHVVGVGDVRAAWSLQSGTRARARTDLGIVSVA